MEKLKCVDCKRLLEKSEFANIITPRCNTCHRQLIINIMLLSCSIM